MNKYWALHIFRSLLFSSYRRWAKAHNWGVVEGNFHFPNKPEFKEYLATYEKYVKRYENTP
jgi:hypothetical protein